MSPETLRLLTIIVSIVALVMSSLSLAWQIISWRYTGSFVKAESFGKFVVMPEGPPHGYLVSIRARNVGRSPVTVTGWSFALRDGHQLMTFMQDYWQGPKIPHRLEAGDEVSWYAQETELLDGMGGKPDSAEVLPQVFLATGKKVSSRKKLRKQWLTIDRSKPE